MPTILKLLLIFSFVIQAVSSGLRPYAGSGYALRPMATAQNTAKDTLNPGKGDSGRRSKSSNPLGCATVMLNDITHDLTRPSDNDMYDALMYGEGSDSTGPKTASTGAREKGRSKEWFYSQGFMRHYIGNRESAKRSQTHFNRYPAQTRKICDIYDRLSAQRPGPVVIWYLGASKMYDVVSIAAILLNYIREKGAAPDFIINAVEADGRLIEEADALLGDESYMEERRHIVTIHDNFVYPQEDPLLLRRIEQADIIVIHDVLYQLQIETVKDFARHMRGVKEGCYILTSRNDLFEMRTADPLMGDFFSAACIDPGKEGIVDASFLLEAKGALPDVWAGNAEEAVTMLIDSAA